MTIRSLLKALACAALVASATSAGAQETIRLRIASGHPPANTYVNLMQNFFVPEVTKRVAAKTKYKIEFVEGYGGAMVKVADTLEGVQSGIIDIGGFCFCFEPSNLPLHAFQVMLPFGTMDPETSLKVARAVYDKVPYMSKVFEDKFRQKLIALIADNGYNLGTNFEWNYVADLKGVKIAGAGLNLKWLEFAGATPVQSSLVDAYTSMQTGVYNGWIMFPSGWVNFKLYEVGKFYTEIGFGAITWHGLTDQLRALGASCRRKCRTSSWRSPRNTRPRPAHSEPGGLSETGRRAQEARRQWSASCRTRCGRTGRSRSPSGRPRKPRNSTPRACPARRCSTSRSKRPKTTATSGRCAIT